MIKWIKRNLVTLILLLILLVGLSLIAYPTVADWWNSLHQSRLVTNYAQAVANLDKEKYDQMLLEAEEYNKSLANSTRIWNGSDEEIKAYNSILDVNGTGIMGYIDISKIQVQLPIYHGTDETVLEIGIGHLYGTSLPVGGATSHCAISGHRGLPSAKLFTDIDKLVIGDTWTISILDQTFTYEVDQIRVVDPANLKDIQIVPGKDYCTLVTCTPYGINTHRLLVRGHRIANLQGNARVTADAIQIDTKYVAPFVAAPILLILLVLMLFDTRKSKQHR